VLHSVRVPVPVIVVGNITAGGTGKTPLVLWVCDFLRERGYEPGIVSRGYGGRGETTAVRGNSAPELAGDERYFAQRGAQSDRSQSRRRRHA
jgi:tetraacyldisaccharide 4'-kinase